LLLDELGVFVHRFGRIHDDEQMVDSDADNWHRAYGNENWEFDESDLMRWRQASIDDLYGPT
jgi:nuclear transport factor 2 (NTF2) superfamily protein